MKNKKLTLAKTHDKCVGGNPEIAVVMIHGIASNSATFDSALKHLEEKKTLGAVRFVTFDLLGAGMSLTSDELEYDYKEQLEALHNAILDLKLGETPLVLVGHSLGTFIVTRYAATYPKEVSQLILVSPPVYTVEDFDNPAFAVGIKAFEDMIRVKDREIAEGKAFRNSMDKIVLDKKNYATLAGLKVPTTIIYGDADQLIASYNIPRLVKDNPDIQVIRTIGRHGVTQDKYSKIAKLIDDALSEQSGEVAGGEK